MRADAPALPAPEEPVAWAQLLAVVATAATAEAMAEPLDELPPCCTGNVVVVVKVSVLYPPGARTACLPFFRFLAS